MEHIERVTATKIIIRVDGFHDAKDWMYRVLRAGIATCSSCDKPAGRIYWQDQAEWYFECDDHYTPHGMWSGHTRWNPEVFSKRVIPELAQAWIATLDPDERQRVRLKEYDATDWYSWIVEGDWKNPDEIILRGTESHGTKVRLRPLKNGQYAYQIENFSYSYSYMHELIAPFDSRDAAIEAAKARVGA